MFPRIFAVTETRHAAGGFKKYLGGAHSGDRRLSGAPEMPQFTANNYRFRGGRNYPPRPPYWVYVGRIPYRWYRIDPGRRFIRTLPPRRRAGVCFGGRF